MTAITTSSTNRRNTESCNEEFLKNVLAYADPNVLRLALYQLTADEKLAKMKVESVDVWAGALQSYALAPEHHDEVRALALAYLKSNPDVNQAEAAEYGVEDIRRVMEIFGHGPLNDSEFQLAYEEGSFDEFPRDVHWHTTPPAENLAESKVLVVGAGVSGIAVAIVLGRLGIPYEIVERNDGIGGTWWVNDYPEARVDSSSLIYQYKFEKKYPWPEFFSSGVETRKYLEHVAEKYSLIENVAFNTELTEAKWNAKTKKWDVALKNSKGEKTTGSYRFIISASGLFSTPNLPDIEGIETFAGKICHTTSWDHGYELNGKRIALIGTGASGAQLAPYLAKHGGNLAVFQRTATYVLPMEGYRDKILEEMQWLIDNFPFYYNWLSYAMYYTNAQLEGLQEFDVEWQKQGGKISARNDKLREVALEHIKVRFAERPDLIEKSIPPYPPLARRPTIDNGWYDTLLRDNVELVTSGIRKIVPDGIVDKDGKLRKFDFIVCAAGFQTTKYFWPTTYIGDQGATLDDLWNEDGPRAYLGITLPGFPNLFTCFGPNSQGRSGSFFSMSEAWAKYAVTAIAHVIESGKKSIVVRKTAYDAYNRKLDELNKNIIWEAFGKGFYYLTKDGRSFTNSPWRSPEIHDLLRKPEFDDFKIQ